MNTSDNPNPESLVPFYTFPETLEDQLASLESNPLMQRLLASRKGYDDDPHRPQYHYVNPEGALNDPNGLCFWQGKWHLFYQGYPPEDTRQHWGHAVSDDLVRWQDLPYCIYPGPEDCCFSGATFVEDDRVIAMYHGTKVGNMVAVSKDPLLLNWEKLSGKAVIPLRRADGTPQPFRVFDPCVWKKGSDYYSLSAGTRRVGPGGKPIRANFLLRSNDLVDWEYLHPFVEEDAFTLVGDDGACPYFWPIGKGPDQRHILLFYSHMSGGQYLLGDYDKQRDKFIVTHGAKFNFGASNPAGVHAPSATPDNTGGVIVVFNMNPGKSFQETVTKTIGEDKEKKHLGKIIRDPNGWNQIMTLPRRLTVKGDSLQIEPIDSIKTLRGKYVHVGRTILPANEEIVLHNVRGNCMEINAEINSQASPMVELNVLRSSGREEITRIAFYRERGFRDRISRTILDDAPEKPTQSIISIDSSYSSTAPDVLSRPPENAPVVLEPSENLKLRVFIDHSVVEVFVNNKQSLAVRVYPELEDSIGISLKSQGRPAILQQLHAWQMNSIY